MGIFSRIKGLLHSDRLSQGEPGKPGVVVIGTEMARALEADRAWRAERALDHMSLVGPAYDIWKGEQDLLRFSDSELHLSIGHLVASYRGATSDQRTKMRDRFSLSDCYTLLTFARRSAVRAIRSHDPSTAVDGLVAVVMVEPQRIDGRDISQPVGLLFFALEQLGADAPGAFRQVAGLSESEVATYIGLFPDRFGRDFDLSAWGYIAVDTAEGIGFVDGSIDPYDPTVDLLEAGLGIRAALDTDVYRSSLTIGTALPGVWIGAGPQSPERALTVESIRAGLTVQGLLHRDAWPESEGQQMSVFLCEAQSPKVAAQIADWATSERGAVDHVGFAFAQGPVVAVVVGRSTVRGEGRYESQDSIERFSDPFVAAVRSSI